MINKRVKWTCPHCNNLHYYYWDEDDIFEGEVNMNCESCRGQSKQMMHVDPISGNAWCEVMKETDMTELEQLKKKAEHIQRRIEELEEEELDRKRNARRTLHNVISKWEYYYNKKLQEQIKYDPENSHRNLMEKEIEKILNDIEKWVDDVTKFPLTTYEPGYWSGWDECRKAIKSNLRGPYDWYEISKVNNHYE